MGVQHRFFRQAPFNRDWRFKLGWRMRPVHMRPLGSPGWRLSSAFVELDSGFRQRSRQYRNSEDGSVRA
jgi:hypothetical protein